MTAFIDTARDATSVISPIEEIIEEARCGRPFIIVDAEDRENEGDIIIPAQFASAHWINFMAIHGRGLICLAITAERARHLRLPPMAAENGARHGTAFTSSIEAREGVTTGISAHDRARTIAVAADPAKGPDDLVSPGHVFPLVARDGGVLVRAGHTEAAVDIARLAGLDACGVICEVMNEAGDMARLPELAAFAADHGMKIGTIADLIRHRRHTEHVIERTLDAPFDASVGGQFRMVIYRNCIDGAEHVALVKRDITGNEPVLVRVHALDLAVDLFRQASPRTTYIEDALLALDAHDGPGVLVILRDSGMSWSQLYGQNFPTQMPSLSLREYGIGAQILKDLGVREMILLTGNPRPLAAIAGYGLSVVGTTTFAALAQS